MLLHLAKAQGSQLVLITVRENAYSLTKTGDLYQLSYAGPLPSSCSSFDVRGLDITSSLTDSASSVTLRGLSLLSNLEFKISGSEVTTSSGALLYSFDNNSANVISQNYLLKSCEDGSAEDFYTRYYSSAHTSTAQGLEDMFVHSTELNIIPTVRSVGIEQGNGSLVTVKRVPNVVKYLITSGGSSATLDHTGIDSSDEFQIRLAPLNPGVNISSTVEVTTQPYDVPLKKDIPVDLSTLPSFPTSVTWPYRDRYNLTLKWATDEAALGYFIKVLSSRDRSILQQFENKEPVAEVHDLKPGRFYVLQIIPYNYAGNTTINEDSGYRLFTDEDPPVLAANAVNTSETHIAVEWTGAEAANAIQLLVYDASGERYRLDADASPHQVDGLQPDTEYNMTVSATYDTGTVQSRNRTYRTDVSPTTTAPDLTTTDMMNTTLDETSTSPESTNSTSATTNEALPTPTSNTTSSSHNASSPNNVTASQIPSETSTLDHAATNGSQTTTGSTDAGNSTQQDTATHDNGNSTEKTPTSGTGTAGMNIDPTVDQQDQVSVPAKKDTGLDWWVWLLVGIGVLIVILIIAAVAKLVATSRNEHVPEKVDDAHNKTGFMKTLFGHKRSYAVNKEPPAAVLTYENVHNAE